MDFLLIAQISFLLLPAICLYLIYRGLSLASANFEEGRRKKLLAKYWVFASLWVLVSTAASLSGFMANFNTMPPRIPLFIFPPVILLMIIMRSKTTTELLQNIPPKYLIYIQTFRVPVEILLWFLLLDNVIPIQMTFEGLNFDILAGLTAPIAAALWFVKGKLNRTLGIIWNVVCLLLLINIVTVAILSMPLPIRVFMNEPANTAVAQFPIVFLPTILVPIAYFFHALSIKQLLIKA